MTQPYHIFRDNTGRLQATASTPGSTVIIDFLRSDIRENASHCDTVLDLLKCRLAGQHAGQDYSIGNTYHLSVDKDQAVLKNIHDEQAPGATIPAAELLALLQKWRSFL